MSEITSSTRWEQYSDAGRLLLSRGDPARAEEAFAAAVRAAEREFGAESLQLAASLSALGQLRYQRRDHAAAADYFRRALEIRDRALGPDDLGVAQSINNLAAVHVATNDLDGAEPLLRRALEITERHRGAQHPDVAVNLNNLAKLYFKRGELSRAEPLLRRLLLVKQAQGARHPEVATVLASLATLEQALGDHAAAEAFWREALAIREHVSSPVDAALAPLLENLADCCAARGKRAEAIELRQRALGIREHALGADHPSVASARTRLLALRQAGDGAAPVLATSREHRLSQFHLAPIDAGAPAPAAPTGEAPAPIAPPAAGQREAASSPPQVFPPVPRAPESQAPRVDAPLPAPRGGIGADDAVWWTPDPAPATHFMPSVPAAAPAPATLPGASFGPPPATITPRPEPASGGKGLAGRLANSSASPALEPVSAPRRVPDPAPVAEQRAEAPRVATHAGPRKPNLAYNMGPARGSRGKLWLAGGAAALAAAVAGYFLLVARSSPAPAPVAVESSPPVETRPVASGPSLPVGPVVAPLPVDPPALPRPAAVATAAHDESEVSEPPPPPGVVNLKTIDLDGISQDVDARTRRRIDDEIAADTKPGAFRPAAPKHR